MEYIDGALIPSLRVTAGEITDRLDALEAKLPEQREELGRAITGVAERLEQLAQVVATSNGARIWHQSRLSDELAAATASQQAMLNNRMNFVRSRLERIEDKLSQPTRWERIKDWFSDKFGRSLED